MIMLVLLHIYALSMISNLLLVGSYYPMRSGLDTDLEEFILQPVNNPYFLEQVEQ